MVSGLFAIPKQALRRAPLAPGIVAAPPRRHFLAGPENALLSSALAAVHSPSQETNPLVITGARGTGKSLLLELLVDEFQHRFANVSVLLSTAVDVARAYAYAVQADALGDFRQRYGRLHMLAIDDLQRLEGKQAAQQELLQLVDSLVRRGCLVLATLRSHPLDAGGLFYPLASRFSGGLVVPLALPDVAVRRALLAHFAAEVEIDLTPEAMDLLMSRSNGHARLATAPQLRQAVIRISELARQQGSAPSFGLVEEFLKQAAAEARPTLKAIAAAVGKRFDVSVADLRGKSRLHGVTAARGIAMQLARELSGASYAEIGRYFGNRDHTTVIHACKKTAAAAAESPVQRELEQLRRQLAEDSAP